jgi:hypothetical protein
MKFWFLLFFAVIPPMSFADSSTENKVKTYHVEVVTKNDTTVYAVPAPSDSIAFDSVYIGAVYNKHLKTPVRVTVKETGLSTDDLPQREFMITTETKYYYMYLNIVNPDYALTAIQASKYLMSNTVAREVHSTYSDTKLKSREATRYIVKYKSQEISYLINTNNVEEGRLALDIAARMSKRSSEYIGIKIPNYTCGKMFSN